MSKANKANKASEANEAIDNRVNSFVDGLKNKITNKKSQIENLKGSVTVIDFAVIDPIKVFGGLIPEFPYFREKYKSDCTAEEYNKRYLDLMKKKEKKNIEVSKSFSETGAYFTHHEKENPIFIKEYMKIGCHPKPPKLRKGESKKNSGCWETSECEVNKGLYCDSKMKYTRGVCRKKVQPEKEIK